MKLRVTKPIAILAALLALCSPFACAPSGGSISSSAGESVQSTSESVTTLPDIDHEDVTLSDVEYERPDISGMEAALDDLARGIKQGKDAAEMIASYEAIQQQYAHADSMLSLMYLFYAFDVTNEQYRDE